MKEHTTLVTLLAGGNVTIPAEICEAMGLKEGDFLDITIKRVEVEVPGLSVTPRPTR